MVELLHTLGACPCHGQTLLLLPGVAAGVAYVLRRCGRIQEGRDVPEEDRVPALRGVEQRRER